MSDEKKKEAQKSIYLQYDGKEISIDAVEKAVRENYDSIKKGEDPPEDIRVYLKPEDRKAYYVIRTAAIHRYQLPSHQGRYPAQATVLILRASIALPGLSSVILDFIR